MQFDRKIDGQTRALIMAIGGAAIAAITAMFVPVGLWEVITGSTGISEMIPATAAPLGDTARALIAFGVGALVFAILASVLLRKNAAKPVVAAAPAATPQWDAVDDFDDREPKPSFIDGIRSKIAAFAEARRKGSGISDLEDLPKLRNGDAHPDAPPRRPLSAERDLADPAPAEEQVMPMFAREAEAITIPAAEAEQAESAPKVETYSAPAEVAIQPEPADAAVAVSAPISDVTTLSDMVERLEAALADRDQQLARLEALASAIPATRVAAVEAMAPAEVEMPMVEIAEPAPSRPALEAVESSPRPQSSEAEEMDAALRSALETLHRMNARTR